MSDEAGFEQLSDLAMGFQQSRIFLSAIELDIFTHVGDGADAAEVAGRAGTNLRGTEILLNALVGLGLLSKSQGRFSNTLLSSQFLVAGSPGYAVTGFGHSANLWKAWSNLTQILRSGQAPARPDMSEEQAKDWTESFIMLMHERAIYRAPKVTDAIDLDSANKVLDIGGGPGTHSIEFAKRKPELCAVIFDLPEVIPIAQRIILRAGMQDQVTVIPGDYNVDDFGHGYDLAFLSAIIHSNSPEGNKRILRKAWDCLVPGGRIAIVDFVMDDQKTSPQFGATFAVNMLVATEEGNCYSAIEIEEWFSETGFINPSVKYEIDEDISLMTAAKP